MIDTIRSWILGIAGTALIVCIAEAIVPQGKAKSVCRFAGGVLLIIAVLKPAVGINAGGMSRLIALYKTQTEIYNEKFEEENDRLLKEIIVEDAAAYILDKAKTLGAAGCEVSVATRKEEDGYPYPYEVWVSADMNETQKLSLSKYMTSELGIAEEKQHWSIKNGY